MNMPFGKYEGVSFEALPPNYLAFLNQRYGQLIDHARIRLKIPISCVERRRIVEMKHISKQALRRHPDNEPLVDFIADLFAIFDINI